MVTRIDVQPAAPGSKPRSFRRMAVPGAVVAACLIAQVWIATAVSEPGRAILLGSSILVEYGLLMWSESRSAGQDV